MSEQQQGEWLDSSRTAPSGAGGGRRRGFVIGGIGAALTLIVAGGAVFAYQTLSGGGPQPEEAIPSSAIAYARIDLDPSAGQKIDAFNLLRRFPQFSEQTGITSDRDDLREKIFAEAIGSSDCGLTYDEDVKPWIGDRAAVAAMPGDEEPDALIAIQVTDQATAEDAVDAIADCTASSSSGDPAGIEFVGDYMLIAETPDLATRFATEATDSPLSDNEQFSSDLDELGDPGLASFWVDVDGVVKALASASGGDASFEALTSLKDVNSYSGTFRAGDNYLELAVQASTSRTWEVDNNAIVGLPESTVGALSISNGGDQVDQLWSDLQDGLDTTQPGMFDEMVTSFEDETGLQLPDDLQTLLGDNLTFAVDSRGLDLDRLNSPADLASTNIGLRLSGDKDAAVDLVDRLTATMQDQGVPFALSTTETDDGVVVATNDDYADELASGGRLGDTDAFVSAVPDAEEAAAVFYVNVDQAEAVARSFFGVGGDGNDELGYLEPLQSFGVTSYQIQDGYAKGLVRLTFD